MIFEQDLALSIIYSALAGFTNVLGTLLLALPDVREKQGRPFSTIIKNTLYLGNLILAILIVAFSFLGSLYGPVSIVLPTAQSSMLLFNMIIFGAVMGIESFTKNMILGTLVMTTASVLLPVVGPAVQDNQDIEKLLMKSLSLAWYGTLIFVMVVSGVLAMIINLKRTHDSIVTFLLLTAQVSSKVVSTTVSKTFATVTGSSLVISLASWILSSIFLVYTVYKQATVVQQSIYVPLMVSSTLVLNALTGIIIWEDWRVINSWTGYACVFLLFIIGNDLMSDVDLLGIENRRYGISEMYTKIKQRCFKRGNDIDEIEDQSDDDDMNEGNHSLTNGTIATGYISVGGHSQKSRDAWKDAFQAPDVDS